jgi:YgiT-type zinc finger domain-containing protein
MKCFICKNGETKEGVTTVTLTRGETVIIVKNVPAEICDNCGEYYLSEDITKKIFELANEAVKRNTEIEILKYVA